jgi:hypothetical protein
MSSIGHHAGLPLLPLPSLRMTRPNGALTDSMKAIPPDAQITLHATFSFQRNYQPGIQ